MSHEVSKTLAVRRQTLMLLGATLIAIACRAQPLRAAADTDARRLLARQLARETGLDASGILQILNRAEFKPSIIRRIKTPYEAKPYADYRKLFITPTMRRQGEQFLRKHAEILTRQEQRYGIERQIIAAILGMETRFGRYRGKDRLLDSLYTLSTGYARRAEFFRHQLGEFLLLCREEKLKPEQVLGSYAGAFGTTQFIPSSFRAYAVDADGDGKRDVWHSVPDITASVGNYFRQHGWQQGRPVAHWLPYQKNLKQRAEHGIRTWSPLAELRAKLPELPPIWHDRDKTAIITMRTDQGRQMALVHYNFYVITRWNRSYNYAMATAEIAAMLGCDSCRVG